MHHQYNTIQIKFQWVFNGSFQPHLIQYSLTNLLETKWKWILSEHLSHNPTPWYKSITTLVKLFCNINSKYRGPVCYMTVTHSFTCMLFELHPCRNYFNWRRQINFFTVKIKVISLKGNKCIGKDEFWNFWQYMVFSLWGSCLSVMVSMI